MYIYVYININIYICTHIHIHIHTYIHTYIHKYIHVSEIFTNITFYKYLFNYINIFYEVVTVSNYNIVTAANYCTLICNIKSYFAKKIRSFK